MDRGIRKALSFRSIVLMVRICVAILLVFSFSFLHGQLDSAYSKIEEYTEKMESTFKRISFPVKANNAQSLFVDTEWQHSFLVDPNNEVIHFNGRYNILNNSIELIYKWQGQRLRALSLIAFQ